MKYKRKNPNYKKQYKNSKLDFKILKTVSSLMPKAEFKYKQFQGTDSPSQTGSVYLLNGLSKTNDSTGREGDRYDIKSIEMRYWVEAQPLVNPGTHENCVGRILIVNDLQPNAATITASDVLAGAYGALSMRNLSYRSRFQIIYDKSHSLSSGGPSVATRKVYKKLNLPVTCSTGANTGGIADITTGALYAIFISSEAGPFGNYPIFFFNIRLRYVG